LAAGTVGMESKSDTGQDAVIGMSVLHNDRGVYEYPVLVKSLAEADIRLIDRLYRDPNDAENVCGE